MINRDLISNEVSLHKIVFEVKFKYGYQYLDKCGRIMNSLFKNDSGWQKHKPNIDPQRATIRHEIGIDLLLNADYANFSYAREFGAEQIDIDKYLEIIQDNLVLFYDELEIQSDGISRMGFRSMYLYPVKNREDALQLLEDNEVVKIKPNLANCVNGELESASFVFNIDGQDRNYSIRLNIAEVQLPNWAPLLLDDHSKKKGKDKTELLKKIKQDQLKKDFPELSLMIDIDTSIDNLVDYEDIQINEFVKENLLTNKDKFIPSIIRKNK